MLLHLLTTSLLSGLSLTAPTATTPRDANSNLKSCSSSYFVTLAAFQKAAMSFCNEKIRANAPMTPVLPTLVIDPHNKPVMPPLSQLWVLSGPDGKMFKAKFEITGFGPLTREFCRQGWAMEGKWKAETLDEQVIKGNICKGKKGEMLVQGWDGAVWWNKFKVKFWGA
jgi:hypothetical protein